MSKAVSGALAALAILLAAGGGYWYGQQKAPPADREQRRATPRRRGAGRDACRDRQGRVGPAPSGDHGGGKPSI